MSNSSTSKQFIFLYPIPQIVGFEIHEGAFRSSHGCKERFKKEYSTLLNTCIDQRYRQRGFKINYALFDGSPLSKAIHLQEEDAVIEVGLDFQTHRTQRDDGSHPYPDQDHILDQLGSTDVLRVAGFHLWDCVQRLAKKAHERGIDALVDEDLTELLKYTVGDLTFKTDTYPNKDPSTGTPHWYELFMDARRGKPWMLQEESYPKYRILPGRGS